METHSRPTPIQLFLLRHLCPQILGINAPFKPKTTEQQSIHKHQTLHHGSLASFLQCPLCKEASKASLVEGYFNPCQRLSKINQGRSSFQPCCETKWAKFGKKNTRFAAYGCWEKSRHGICSYLGKTSVMISLIIQKTHINNKQLFLNWCCIKALSRNMQCHFMPFAFKEYAWARASTIISGTVHATSAPKLTTQSCKGTTSRRREIPFWRWCLPPYSRNGRWDSDSQTHFFWHSAHFAASPGAGFEPVPEHLTS